MGTVVRSHAGGYLVHSDELDATFQCLARGRLKKERRSIVTGDKVELDEIDRSQGKAVIAARLDRQNLLSRPLIANVDQVVIVQSVHQPEWNALLCDRYLVHSQLELPSASILLCLNKCDLAAGEDLRALQKIYEPLGFKMLIVSAISGQGMRQFAKMLSGKVSVLAGPSGVGKSSLINHLDLQLNLKVGVMENDFGVGRHTTTYSELYRIGLGDNLSLQSSWVADTPGFSLTELKHGDPADVAWQFPEIVRLAQECKFSNCLHLVENGCKVLLSLDTIATSRYQSYSIIVNEALAEARLRQESSQKVESAVKVVGGKGGKGKVLPKLNERYRAVSRRSEKQQLANLTVLSEEDTEYPEDSPD